MTGLGHVEPGGSALTTDLGDVTMTKVSVGSMDNNAYLLQPASGPSVLIDAASDHSRLLEIIGDSTVSIIATTHQHHDHIGALAPVAAATRARLVAGRDDAVSIADQTGVPTPEPVWTGDTLPLGEETLEVIGLVGHTPGSITLAYAAADGITHLFTGDSLFPGGPGRTRSPEAFSSLMDDLESKIFGRFADETVVHPGHGDDTTLGTERPQLAEWRARGW